MIDRSLQLACALSLLIAAPAGAQQPAAAPGIATSAATAGTGEFAEIEAAMRRSPLSAADFRESIRRYPGTEAEVFARFQKYIVDRALEPGAGATAFRIGSVSDEIHGMLPGGRAQTFRMIFGSGLEGLDPGARVLRILQFHSQIAHDPATRAGLADLYIDEVLAWNQKAYRGLDEPTRSGDPATVISQVPILFVPVLPWETPPWPFSMLDTRRINGVFLERMLSYVADTPARRRAYIDALGKAYGPYDPRSSDRSGLPAVFQELQISELFKEVGTAMGARLPSLQALRTTADPGSAMGQLNAAARFAEVKFSLFDGESYALPPIAYEKAADSFLTSLFRQAGLTPAEQREYLDLLVGRKLPGGTWLDAPPPREGTPGVHGFATSLLKMAASRRAMLGVAAASAAAPGADAIGSAIAKEASEAVRQSVDEAVSRDIQGGLQ